MTKTTRIILCALSALVLMACGGKKSAQEQQPMFSADSAYAYVQAQMAFGPRVPNGDGHTRCAVYLIEKLREAGAYVELQKGEMPDYSGRQQKIFNIIGHFNMEAQGQPILLCAHYDTRPWCDEEEDYMDRYMNVPGANDGASGVAVLLEVARQLGLSADSAYATFGMYKQPVDIVFFDCEDMGTPTFYTGAQRENTWCLGSQLWAAQNEVPYQFGILLDMVGAPDATFPREFYSSQYAANYQEKVWRAAGELGYGRYFSNLVSYPITDDHFYVNTIAGVPCVDIIHYDANGLSGFAPWWHTREDDMRNISAETLMAVGRVVLQTIR